MPLACHTAAIATLTVAALAAGASPAVAGNPLVVSPAHSAYFGKVRAGNFSDRTFTLTNTGRRSVRVTSIDVDGLAFSWADRFGNPDDQPFRCMGRYLPGRSCTFFAQFYPWGNGVARGTYTVSTSRGDRVVKVSGRGFGYEPPASGPTPAPGGPVCIDWCGVPGSPPDPAGTIPTTTGPGPGVVSDG